MSKRFSIVYYCRRIQGSRLKRIYLPERLQTGGNTDEHKEYRESPLSKDRKNNGIGG